MHIAHVIPQLRTTNLGAATEFYTATLGFALEFQYEDFYASASARAGSWPRGNCRPRNASEHQRAYCLSPDSLPAAEWHPANLADFLEDDGYTLQLPRREGLRAWRELLNEDFDHRAVAHTNSVSDRTRHGKQLAAVALLNRNRAREPTRARWP